MFQKTEELLDPVQTSCTRMHKILYRWLSTINFDILFNRLDKSVLLALVVRRLDELITDLNRRLITAKLNDERV